MAIRANNDFKLILPVTSVIGSAELLNTLDKLKGKELIMHSIPGLLVILGGILLLLNKLGIIDIPEYVWPIAGATFIIIAGIGLIITGRIALKFKNRVRGRLSRVIEKIERLHEIFELQRKHESSDDEYADLTEMIKLYDASPSPYRASKLWDNAFIRHIRWLKENGVANFKRSVNLSYFQWKIGLRTDQLFCVLRGVHIFTFLKNFFNIWIPSALTDSTGTARQNKVVYRLFMTGLLEKLRSIDNQKLLDSVTEPLCGNPWLVYYRNKLISQDLCNSLIEL